MHEDDIKWCKAPRQSWEIANRLHLFDEAIYEGLNAIEKEKWDAEKKKKMEKALRELTQRKAEFFKVVWIAKIAQEGEIPHENQLENP